MRFSSILLIRVAVAVMFIVHGIARIVYGGVTPFGGFLDSSGFPVGLVWAWAVTYMEIGRASCRERV